MEEIEDLTVNYKLDARYRVTEPSFTNVNCQLKLYVDIPECVTKDV